MPYSFHKSQGFDDLFENTDYFSFIKIKSYHLFIVRSEPNDYPKDYPKAKFPLIL